MRIILIGFIFLFFNGYAQNITIKGKAHASHIGKEVKLYDFSDYVTYTRVEYASDTIGKDGYFELKIQSKNTKPILLNIQNLIGKLYVQPNFVYGVYFPEADSTINNQEGTESNVNISIYGKDSTELNALIIDFNNQYSDFFTKASTSYLSPSKINAVLDSFIIFAGKRYKGVNNAYFKKYREYSCASFLSNTSRSKTLLHKQFIDKKPILYSNYEYMEFINTYYTGYLKAYGSTKIGGNIYNSINAFADYKDLKQQFNADKTITNDTLRELVLLKGLIDFYYSADFDKKQVQSVIEQLYNQTNYRENKNIALNLLQTIYKLQPGAKAPDFVAIDKAGQKVNLSNYKGKHIYLNFFSTKSDMSMQEMQKIIELKKKFNDKVTFISVCLDDSLKLYKNYLKANPKQDWVILYQSNQSSAKQAFNIISFSGYFFINAQMQFIQSPAIKPSEGIEYNFNSIFRPKRRNIITGVR
jgi:Redoxin